MIGQCYEKITNGTALTHHLLLIIIGTSNRPVSSSLGQLNVSSVHMLTGAPIHQRVRAPQ
jgi:hypothetical protein